MPHATSPQGRLLGDFRIAREIGRGGMGVVYEALDERTGRRVALKVLEAHLTLQRSAVDRFLREAHAAAALRHDHIVPVEGAGEQDGVHFFAMELVDGASIADVIAALAAEQRGEPDRSPDVAALAAPYRQRPFNAAAETIGAIARALHHAHEHGVLHRDVKPSNVLLRRDGTPLLIDFGLAREEGLPALTQTGDLVGSPYYVAPEQCHGGHAELDRRVDVYSLGVVLYELLTLRRPFEGESAQEVLERIQDGAAPPPRTLRPEIPRDLDAIVRRATAVEPRDRYATADELARDLARFLAGASIQARAGGWRRTGRRLVRSRAAWLAAAGVALVGAAVLFGREQRRASRSAAALTSAQLWIESERSGAIAELFDGADAVGSPSRSVTLPLQSPLRLAPGRHALRVRASGHDERVLQGDQALDLAADGELLASVWLAPFSTRLRLELGSDAPAPCAVALSDGDAQELLVADRGGALEQVGGDGSRRRFATLAVAPYRVAVAPDERFAARVVVAAATGLAGFVRGFDRGGVVVLERLVRGRVTALIAAISPVDARPTWLAATDLGGLFDLAQPAGADGTAAPAAELGGPVLALAACGESVVAATRERLVLVADPPRPIEGGDGPHGVAVRLLALPAEPASPARLVVVDGGEARCFVEATPGNVSRDAAFERDHAPLLARVAESDAAAVARRRGGEACLVVAAARRLVGLAPDGSSRFDLALEARATGLTAVDVEGDGVDELAVRLEGDGLALIATEPDVRWKSAAEVDAFVVMPSSAGATPVRVVAAESSGLLVAMAGDGRRVATARLAARAATIAVDAADGRLWIGRGDGGLDVAELREDGLELRSVAASGAEPITAIAIGAVGEAGARRVVTGDRGGALTGRLPDGQRESSFVARRGVPIRCLLVAPAGGEEQEGEIVVAAFESGLLLRFGAAMKPLPPIVLPSACGAVALADIDGEGAVSLLAAMEGGAIAVIDTASGDRREVPRSAKVHAIVALPATGEGEGGALVGDTEGRLDQLGPGRDVVRPIARLGSAVVAVAAGDLDGDGSVERVAATADRIVAFDRAGVRRIDAPARGAAGLAIADVDGDGVAELLHLDELGRLVVRELAPRRR